MRLDDAALDHLRATLAEPQAPDLTGTQYELGEELGRGGMGVVYRAHDRKLDRDVALKVLAVPAVGPGAGAPSGTSPVGSTEAPCREGEPPLAARLVREARVLARLEHPGIVPVHEVGRLADGRVFAAMKLVRGRPLREVLAAAPSPQRGRAAEGLLAERLRLFARILDAVGFAHAQGIVHRDLKPANVMVGAFGEVLVMDWGLAKLLHQPEASHQVGAISRPATEAPVEADSAVTASGAVLGTPGYMAPEQERGDPATIDTRTDIYALGAILTDLLQGFVVPPALAAIARKARAEVPDARYQMVSELAADVERYLSRQPVLAHRERLGDVLRRWYAKYETPILLVVAYLLLRALFVLRPRG